MRISRFWQIFRVGRPPYLFFGRVKIKVRRSGLFSRKIRRCRAPPPDAPSSGWCPAKTGEEKEEEEEEGGIVG